MHAMPRLTTLLLVCASLLPACSGSASASDGKQPAPGHVATTLKLDEKPYCDSCVTRVTESIKWLKGVSAVDVKVGDPNIKVWHDPATVTDDKILEVLNKAGETASLAP
jgi:copper chaperone CopZ